VESLKGLETHSCKAEQPCNSPTPEPKTQPTAIKKQVIHIAKRLGAWCVRGNHCDAALAVYKLKLEGQEVPSKHAWVGAAAAEGSDVDLAYLAALPFTLLMPELGVGVVHAGEGPLRRKEGGVFWGGGAGS